MAMCPDTGHKSLTVPCQGALDAAGSNSFMDGRSPAPAKVMVRVAIAAD